MILLYAKQNYSQWQEIAINKYLNLLKLLNIYFKLDFEPKLRNIKMIYIPK